MVPSFRCYPSSGLGIPYGYQRWDRIDPNRRSKHFGQLLHRRGEHRRVPRDGHILPGEIEFEGPLIIERERKRSNGVKKKKYVLSVIMQWKEKNS